MKKTDALQHFASERGIAEALGISVQAVNKWGEDVPPLRAYQLQEIIRRDQLKAEK